MHPPKLLITIFYVGFLLIGCSKTSQKTLSGVFLRPDADDGQNNLMRYDFRTDGTVIYISQTKTRIADGMAIRIVRVDGKGDYKVQEDKVSVRCYLVCEQSYFPDYDFKPRSWTQTNTDIFRIDGDDLIHLYVVINGEETNVVNEVRYMRRR